jgi:hypothetical protein
MPAAGAVTTAAFPDTMRARWPIEAKVDSMMEGSQNHEAWYI